ncbi:MAG: FAD-binding protein [Ruminococcaceae bacterium]|nr:FAD-binding protein [Oscillospiraceae bacterium]
MKQFAFETIVIGTGAAGYNAACRLKQFGKNVAIITEGVNCGTSRNTGSDKQTYYKLGLGGDFPDSVKGMAENLFAGGSVDGDNALCEAALSVRCFMNLCELGVAFPVNRYGEYIGYKTDHDPYARATSVGPLTSKWMTEALQRQAEQLKIPVFDGYLAIEILKHGDVVCGVLCIEQASGELTAFQTADIVLCTGGPAGIYEDSVYPACHTGSTGLALAAGAKAQNLTEWQYGLASVSPRWNVSGTYMQVLPRFVSVDEDGTEREFLNEYFEDSYEALSSVFLKGYQWPFDSKKVMTGSSVIDLLVYRERVLKGRRVYLDYTKNPFGLDEIQYDRLSEEAYAYLSKAEVLFGTPIERLEKMNLPAIELYRSKGVDLASEYLEIALCAQHNNGGIAVDLWWQTSVRGLFAAGECAGTHGVTRPGGSALNAGQVGSLRAAQYIAQYPNKAVDAEVFIQLIGEKEKQYTDETTLLLAGQNNTVTIIDSIRRKMSGCAAAIRNREKMQLLLDENKRYLENFFHHAGAVDRKGIFLCYKLRDTLITQCAVLTALIDYAETVGNTRGSALCYDGNGGLRAGLEEVFRFSEEDGSTKGKIQETMWNGNGFVCSWRPVRPLPESDELFENVWRSFRENKNIF